MEMIITEKQRHGRTRLEGSGVHAGTLDKDSKKLESPHSSSLEKTQTRLVSYQPRRSGTGPAQAFLVGLVLPKPWSCRISTRSSSIVISMSHM